ncbi:hypothetical protein ACTS9E_15125 [Empedobacter brevis]
MDITTNDLEKAYSLLKWIEPRSSESVQIWNNQNEIMTNFLYKIVKYGKINKMFFQVENLSEANFKKIYKKRKELLHLNFTLKNKDEKWVFIWETNRV